MSRARQYGFLRLDPQGDDYSDLYVPVEIIQWFENDAEVEVCLRTPPAKEIHVLCKLSPLHFTQHSHRLYLMMPILA